MPRTGKVEISKDCLKALKNNEKEEKHIKTFKPTITNTGSMAQSEMSSFLWDYKIKRGRTMATNVLYYSVVDTVSCHPDATAV